MERYNIDNIEVLFLCDSDVSPPNILMQKAHIIIRISELTEKYTIVKNRFSDYYEIERCILIRNRSKKFKKILNL